MKRGLLALAVVGGLVLLAPGAAGQTPEERAARLSQRIMSPFCDGVTLHDCPSAPSDELRAEIADMFRAGRTESEIMDRLEAEFGPGIRATPDNEAAWVTPVLFAAAGILVVVGLVRRWIRPREEAAAEQNGRRISDVDRVRVQAELTAFRDEP